MEEDLKARLQKTRVRLEEQRIRLEEQRVRLDAEPLAEGLCPHCKNAIKEQGCCAHAAPHGHRI